MPAFYLTLLAVLLAGFGARDQATVAGLGLRQGRRPGVLLVALASAAVTAVLAALAARFMLETLPPPARTIFAAIALGLAGLESILTAPRRTPDEPTNSLGALLVVLLAQQITDAARFMVFGVAVGLGAPIVAGAAGMLGGGVLAVLAWMRPDLQGHRVARTARRALGVALVLAALVVAMRQFGIV